ncbi:hypothetical protein [Desulfocicer vacuolatum]|nr:hypothetical protein [Desulfocicer vacuolatum]
MKYSVNQGSISNFVVGRARSEHGPPVAVRKTKTHMNHTRRKELCH